MAASRPEHLPRLAPEFYRGQAWIHWTLTIERRATGWLTPKFHLQWQFALIHTCARYALVCPVYVLMPDHMHLLWLGIDEARPDQRVAMEFFRKAMRPHLVPANWQHQAHDHVLRDSERDRRAFAKIARYICENPMRAEITSRWEDYAFLGISIPGYPHLDVREEHYWDLFWRIYLKLARRSETTRSRS